VQRLAENLWRWTAPHPAWREGDDWPREVGCVYYRTSAATVLIDPLVPAGEEEKFWRELDRDLGEAGTPLLVVLTAPWHARSSAQIAERYRAEIVGAAAVEGIAVLPVPPVEEGQVALFIHEHGALVTAEILADLGSGLSVYPSPVLRDRVALAQFLQELRTLPVEVILPAHGSPVLEGAHEAIAAAIDHAPTPQAPSAS
jgi:glyoxylase-like metal-dependent hydrolase (beta-lactamase superfamily II)